MHTVLLYYKYIKIENSEKVTLWQKSLCQKLDLKGRIIIAPEGINGTVEGTNKNIEIYIKETRTLKEFEDISFKISESNGNSFPKLSVKTRKEIVTLGKTDIFPTPGKTGASYISADELHQWFEEDKKDFVILDMRNNYEFKAGRFDKSLVLPVRYFRDIPKHREELEKLKGKTVVAVCTGGVRCEKGTAYLKSELGFQDIYQLHEGIVTYMDKYPKGYFHGSLYVFDQRITMRTKGMPKEILSTCEKCSISSERFVNCTKRGCRKQFIICENCLDKKDEMISAVCGECPNPSQR